MYTFRVLGTVALHGSDGRRIGSVLSQPKRLALLALIVLEGPRRLQRDEILGLLWPDVPEDRARNSLRQALHYLRRSLGPDVVVGKGEGGVGIAAEQLECDAMSLMRALEEERFGDALALYEGDLLPGFHLDGAPVEFEHWLESTRRRIRAGAAEAARGLAKREAAAGNAVAAGAAGRRAWELGEWSEPGLQELLRLLIRTGDHSGAHDVYAEFAERLLREHGTQPSAATTEILGGAEVEDAGGEVEGLAGLTRAADIIGGAEAVGQLVEPRDDTGAEALTQPAPRAHDSPIESGEAKGRSGWRRRLWPALAAAVATVGVGIWSVAVPQGESVAEAAVSTSAPRTLFLEPVRDIGTEGSAVGLAAAVTTEMAGDLSETDGFEVVALASGENPNATQGIRLRPTLREAGGATQLTVLLLDVPSDAVLERLTVSEVGGGASPEVLAGRMTPRIRQRIGQMLALERLGGRGVDPTALALVREAAEEVAVGNRLRLRGAVEPAALSFAAADSLLRRAAKLDEDWTEPTLRRAELSLQTVWLHLLPPEDDPELAHQEILRGLGHAEAGIETAPSDPRAREVQGVLRYWAGLTAQDHDAEHVWKREAEADLLDAVGRDPALPRAWSILSAMAESRGEFASAYHRARRAYVTDHDLRTPSDILVRLFTNALEVGDAEGAAEWCTEIHRQQPQHWLGPYCDLTRLAWVGPWTVAASDSIRRAGLQEVPEGPAGAPLRARFDLLYAVVLAHRGDGEGAREILASVAGGQPMTLDILDLRAWVRTTLGEPGRAKRLLAIAADQNPQDAARLLKSRRYSGLSSYAVVRSDE